MTKLRLVLMSKGITGKQLAKLAGVSCSSVYKYTSNNRALSEKVATRFASILGVEPKDIMGLINEG